MFANGSAGYWFLPMEVAKMAASIDEAVTKLFIAEMSGTVRLTTTVTGTLTALKDEP